MISEQLATALVEFQDRKPTSFESVLRSLDTLAKRNQGHWKSAKQGLFLLRQIDSNVGGHYQDRRADAWAHRRGFRGRTFSVMKDLGYGKRDPSKIRYSGVVYVVDGGGIVYRGKVKVVHPRGRVGQAELDFGNVQDTFVRRRPPEIIVDPDAEQRARMERNRPDIELIKSIPGWETKDILVDFVRQLERGYGLSLKQRAVVQKMLPDQELFLGSKFLWAVRRAKFKEIIIPKVIAAMREDFDSRYGQYKGSKEQRSDSFSAFRKEGEKGETWGEWYADQVKPYDKAVKVAKGGKFPEDLRWLATRASWNLFHLYSGGHTPEMGVETFQDIDEQMAKAIKAKKPTKKSLGVVAYVTKVVENVLDMSVSQLARRIALARDQERTAA